MFGRKKMKELTVSAIMSNTLQESLYMILN